MRNVLVNTEFPINKYWELIRSTLSRYEEKFISENEKLIIKIIENNYFLENDIWDILDIGQIPNFEEQYEKYKGTSNVIKFLFKKQTVNLEFKFLFYNKLFKEEWSLPSAFGTNKTNLNKLTEFLNDNYSNTNSFLELDIEEAEKQWIFWLNQKGIKTIKITRHSKYGEMKHNTPIVNFLRQMYNELLNQTDLQEEWEKDRWSVKALNERYGIKYNDSRSDYYINFTSIENNQFKKTLKRYLKSRLTSGKNFSWGTAQIYSRYVSNFLTFINELEPKWNDLKNLNRNHIEKYLETLHRYANKELKNKNSNPTDYILKNVTYVYVFLQDIQRLDYDVAPGKSTSILLRSEDYPVQRKKSNDDIDYIPDYVLEQLFEKIDTLNSDIQPIIWIAFKTGLRISDTLGLTQDCLIRLNGKYSIVTDIEKTFVKGHRVPIDEKLANVIAVLIEKSKQISNSDNNPNKYIFVCYGGHRKGKPFHQSWVQETLNKFSVKMNIVDELGEVFHFKNHQFRHTYAVKMINGGADILTVQELLAHASPEMTMRYARLLDDTKRKAFEQVMKQGMFTFDLNGEMHEISESDDIPNDIIDMMWKNEKLNALDNPYGSCRARVNGNCPLATEPPCLTANNGKPCFDLAVGISDMDVKKYEIHIESTTKMIETAKQFGREDMVEANQKNLNRYQEIYETIKSGNVIFGRKERMEKELNKNRKKEKKYD